MLLDLTLEDLSQAPWAYPGKMAPMAGILRGSVFTACIPSREGFERTLKAVGAPPLEARRPLLALGALGSPSFLAPLLGSLPPEARCVPYARGEVRGLRRTFAAHVDPGGYIPVAPVPQEGGLLKAPLLFLQEEQMEVLDHAFPAEERRLLSPREFPLRGQGVPTEDPYEVYLPPGGLLAPEGDHPLPLMGQRALLLLLGSHGAPFSLREDEEVVEEVHWRLAREEAEREAWRETFLRRGWVLPQEEGFPSS